VNWRSRKAVLGLIGGVCLLIFGLGMAAAWHNRDTTICRDGKPPVQQRGGILGQIVYRCHDGQIVTAPG
jgi:hypothetical protein